MSAIGASNEDHETRQEVRVTSFPGSTSWARRTVPGRPEGPAVDIVVTSPELGKELYHLELSVDAFDAFVVEALKDRHAHVATPPSSELVDAAVTLLEHVGWYTSVDGCLNPPEPPKVERTFTVTVRTEADEPFEVAEKALLRRLRPAADRDRFTVTDNAGEVLYDGRGTL